MSEPLWQPRTDPAARLLGAGFFAGGAALIGYQIKVILSQVAAGAEHVNYFLAAFGLGGMGVLLGLFWLIRGLAGYTVVRSLQQNPHQMRMFTVIVIVAMIATYAGVRLWLGSLGYEE